MTMTDNTLRTGVDYIGNQPIYHMHPTYIEFELPFHAYAVRTKFWTGEVNVSAVFLHYYDERLAVALTTWSSLRERFGAAFDAVCSKYGRHNVRAALINDIEFERMF